MADTKAHIEHLNRELARLDATNTQLVRDIREMDQLVYQMSQAGSAEQLRSAVARAWAITEARMRKESNRITEILIPELKKVYGDDALARAEKQVAGSATARLEGPADAGTARLRLPGRKQGD